MITAEVIADSISPDGHRLTTVQCEFPRYILAEVNTHRAFSRNSASSRAIPTSKLIEQVRSSPVLPWSVGKNQPGMQAAELLNDSEWKTFRFAWEKAANQAADTAEKFLAMGIHKQHANRVLEPFMSHTAIITATEDGWDNFFDQRISPLAQPEIRLLATAIKGTMNMSVPEPRERDEWHLPYLDHDTMCEIWDRTVAFSDAESLQRRVSAARCARVSYLTHDGKRDIDKDLDLYEKLITADPPHYSPLEHVAMPSFSPDRVGNLTGWAQLRHRKFWQ